MPHKFEVGEVWADGHGEEYEIRSISDEHYYQGIPQPIRAVRVGTGVEFWFTVQGYYRSHQDYMSKDNLVKLIREAPKLELLQEFSGKDRQICELARQLQGCGAKFELRCSDGWNATPALNFSSEGCLYRLAELTPEQSRDVPVADAEDHYMIGKKAGWQLGVTLARTIADLMDGRDREQALRMISAQEEFFSDNC